MVAIPDEYMNPDMMAIGDSLYQGVRSLTIKRGLTQLSAPAQVAEALGIRHRFFCPDPARAILVDMEEWLRWLPDFDRVKKDLGDNAAYWLSTPKSPSGRQLFENISIASATVADLYEDTWQTADDYIKGLPSGLQSRLKRFDFEGVDLGVLVQALNTRFTLNPTGAKAYRNMSQVDLVAARKPKRLLVNIGSNNGLWNICFEADPKGRVKLTEEMTELGARLNALPPEVEAIYFNSLGLPSTVSNLMPLPDHLEWDEKNKPGKSKYYATYENRFGFGYGTISGAQMKALDAHVAEVNAEVRSILSKNDTAKRIRFVDMAALLGKYDSKHRKRVPGNVVKLKNKKTLTNVTTEADFWGAFARGGFQGLDGLHPTVVGYALMAQQVLDAIAASEGGAKRKVDLDEAFRRDKLLTDMPGIWSLGLWMWRDVRKALDRGDPDPAVGEDRAQVKDVLRAACCAAPPKRATA